MCRRFKYRLRFDSVRRSIGRSRGCGLYICYRISSIDRSINQSISLAALAICFYWLISKGTWFVGLREWESMWLKCSLDYLFHLQYTLPFLFLTINVLSALLPNLQQNSSVAAEAMIHPIRLPPSQQYPFGPALPLIQPSHSLFSACRISPATPSKPLQHARLSPQPRRTFTKMLYLPPLTSSTSTFSHASFPPRRTS